MNYAKKVLVFCLLAIGVVVMLSAAELPITANLLLRLDGSDVTHSDGAVGSWNNQATGGVVSANFVQSTASAKPMLVSDAVAGHAALRFDGSNDYLANAMDSAWNWDFDLDANNDARWTTFIVLKADINSPSTRQQHILRSSYTDLKEGAATFADTGVWGAWLYGDDYRVHGRDSAGAYVGAERNDAVKTGAWHIVVGRIQNVLDPSIALFVDGVLVGSQSNAVTRQMNGHRLTCIGCNSATFTQGFVGLIAEILVYKEALSDSEIDQVNRYLHGKYTPTTALNDGLLLHCPMDNKYVNRNGVKPPPALTTDGGDWSVVSWIDPATNGTARSDDTSGSVISSEEGVINEGILFSSGTGGKRRIDFGSADALEAGSGSLSVSLWFKPADISNGIQFIAAHGNGGSADGGWSIWSSPASKVVNFRCCNNVTSPGNTNKAQLSCANLVNGQWYHAVMVLDRFGNKLRAYINGSADGTYISDATWGDTFMSDPIATSRPLLFGVRSDYVYSFKGAVDDFAIWNRALTGEEIAEIYAKGLLGETFAEFPPLKGTTVLIK